MLYFRDANSSFPIPGPYLKVKRDVPIWCQKKITVRANIAITGVGINQNEKRTSCDFDLRSGSWLVMGRQWTKWTPCSWTAVGLLCAVVWKAKPSSSDGPDFGGAHKTQPSVDGFHKNLVRDLSDFTSTLRPRLTTNEIARILNFLVNWISPRLMRNLLVLRFNPHNEHFTEQILLG